MGNLSRSPSINVPGSIDTDQSAGEIARAPAIRGTEPAHSFVYLQRESKKSALYMICVKATSRTVKSSLEFRHLVL